MDGHKNCKHVIRNTICFCGVGAFDLLTTYMLQSFFITICTYTLCIISLVDTATYFPDSH